MSAYSGKHRVCVSKGGGCGIHLNTPDTSFYSTEKKGGKIKFHLQFKILWFAMS